MCVGEYQWSPEEGAECIEVGVIAVCETLPVDKSEFSWSHRAVCCLNY